MKKVSLKFDYSLEYEIQRIKNTLDDSEWFIKNGYSKWMKLPAGEKLEELDKNKSIDYLFDRAKEEFDKEPYIKAKNEVNEQWDKFSQKLEKYFQETSLDIEEFYYIQLTRYGVGGSYNLPNKIIVNIQNKFGIAIPRVIIHEIIHLSIQPFIDKYKIEHWAKERIVDLIVSGIIPKISKMQDVPIDTRVIDKSFYKYYPDIEKVIKNIKK